MKQYQKENLERHFNRIGAQAKIRDAEHDFNLRIRPRKGGFNIDLPEDADLRLLQGDVGDRHLLLFDATENRRILCGHDERHWFTANISAPVSTVREAKASLMPNQLDGKAMSTAQINTRRNKSFVRQGEWFFIPDPNFDAGSLHIYRNEPLQRAAGGKPHIVAELIRFGGTPVYVQGDQEYTERRFRRLEREGKIFGSVRRMMRGAKVLVRGTVRHPDHKTITLQGWHQVEVNTEQFATTMALGFLD